MTRSVSKDNLAPRLVAALSTAEKREYLQTLHAAAERGEAWHGSMTADLRRLASDADWSVRQDVAGLLVFVPDEIFNELAAHLTTDANAYVKRTAEQSKQRRRIAHQEAKRASRGLDEFTKHFEHLARRHGTQVAEEAKRLGERRFQLMSGTLAHDLLGILAVVRSHASLVSEHGKKLPLDARSSAREVDDGLELLHRSLQDLLRYSEPLPAERADESLVELLQKARGWALEGVAERGLNCSMVMIVNGTIDKISVSVSRHLVLTAIGNLIKNAIESFADKNGNFAPGKVTIGTKADAKQVVISIHNTGKGLSPDKLAALTAWLPGRKNRHKKFSTGFGLLNAKKNIEEHGGTLRFESEIDRGVTAIVTLPR